MELGFGFRREGRCTIGRYLITRSGVGLQEREGLDRHPVSRFWIWLTGEEEHQLDTFLVIRYGVDLQKRSSWIDIPSVVRFIRGERSSS